MAHLRKSIGSLVRDRSGAVAAVVALAVPVFLIATAAAVDMGVLYIFRNKLQTTADASALAGASALPDEDQMDVRALAVAAVNMPSDQHGNVLVGTDVIAGHWARSAGSPGVFAPGGTPINAVQVTIRRTTANGNAVASFFSKLFGIGSYDVVRSAVAVNGGGSLDDCLRNGFLANGQLEVGSDVTITGETCVHGQEGLKVGSDVVMTGSGVDVTYGEDSEFEGRNNSGNSIPNANQEDKIFPVDIDSILDAFLDDPSEAPQPNWGPWTVVNQSGDWKPSAAQCSALNNSHNLYIVTGKVELTDCSTTTTMQGFAVYAGKEIILPSGSSSPNQFKMQDMYFASNDYINVGSNVDIGGSNFCSNGLGATFFIARNRIVIQSDVRMWGAQIISGASGPTSPGVELGDDLQTQATAIWSAGYLKVGSNPNLNGNTESESCTQDDHILTHSGNLALRLVR